MVTFEGLPNVDSWLYRQSFNVDSWLLSDTFSQDSDLLARALHTTVTAPHSLSPSSAFTDLSSPHTISSASDPEIFCNGAKRKHNNLLTVSNSDGKLAKRRSRTSKKSQTTYITADPSNFRQMVQQVTGANYIHASPCDVFAPIKPEPHRLVNRSSGPSDQSTAVPTLDTSAFLSNLAVGNNLSNTISLGPPSVKPNTKVDAGVSAVEFDTYSTFPTLESWKVM